MTIEPWLQRVIAERNELQDKLTKLTVFLHSDGFAHLSEMSRGLLRIQYGIMQAYVQVLTLRMEINTD